MDKWTIAAAVAAVVVSALGTGLIMWINMRKKYIAFAEDICESIDTILRGGVCGELCFGRRNPVFKGTDEIEAAF